MRESNSGSSEARDPNRDLPRIGAKFGRQARYSFLRADGRREYHAEIFQLGRQFHPASKVLPPASKVQGTK